MRFLVLLFASVGVVRADGAQTELLLVAGEERAVTPPFVVSRAELDDPTLCEASLRDGKTVVLVARRAGASTLKLFDGAGEVGAEYSVHVFSSSTDLLRHDAGARRGTDGQGVRLGDLAPALPADADWSLTRSPAAFRAEHLSGGAVVEGSVLKLHHGVFFKDAEPEILADRQSLVVDKRSFRFKEHEASIVSWVGTDDRLGYRFIATATPYPVNLEYVVIDAVVSPTEAEKGEAYFSSVLESLGAPRPQASAGVPFINRRSGFLVRYPAGWTVGGETAEGTGFYQNSDNRPVVNVTVERLPGSYAPGDGLARAAGLLFERSKSRGAFRVEAERALASTVPWSRQVLFERGLRQRQVVLLFEPHAFALVLTAEAELFRTYEPAFSALVSSFRLIPSKR